MNVWDIFKRNKKLVDEGIAAPFGVDKFGLPYKNHFESIFLNPGKLGALIDGSGTAYAYSSVEKKLVCTDDSAFRFDHYYSDNSGLSNAATGTGGNLDVSLSDFRQAPVYQLQQLWTTLYRTSPIAKRLVNVVSDAITTDGFIIDIADKKKQTEDSQADIDKILTYRREKRVDHIESTAVRQMFMHGGCALYIDVANEDPYEPLDMNTLQGRFLGFRLIDRGLLYPVAMNNVWNIGSPNFNKPEKWQFALPNNGSTRAVDASRFIFFVPDELPFWARIDQLWWGDSIFIAVKNYIDIIDRGLKSAGNQIMQASMAFLKAPLLNQPIGSGDRVEGMSSGFQRALSGVGNAQLIDKSFDIERLEISNLEQQGQLAETVINLVCAAEGVPISEFYGSKAGGAHASDPTLLSWNKTIAQKKERYFRAPLQRIMDILSRVVLGRKDAIVFTFNDANQMTDPQKADLRLKEAQANAINRSISVVDRKTIARDIVNKSEYPGITLKDVEEMIDDPIEGPNVGTESKDIKDDNSADGTPSKKIKHISPEAVTSRALGGKKSD